MYVNHHTPSLLTHAQLITKERHHSNLHTPSLILRMRSYSISSCRDMAEDNSLYPIAVLIDELRNDDVQVREQHCLW